MWVVTIHGVGNAAPGETARLVAEGVTGEIPHSGKLQVGGRNYPHYRARRWNFVEVNWSDLQSPWPGIPGFFRHLVAVSVAMLRPDPGQMGEAGRTRLRPGYRAAMEGFAAWSVYPVLLALAFQGLAGWQRRLFVATLLGVVAALVAAYWTWSRWLRAGGLACLAVLAAFWWLLAAGYVPAARFTATTALVYRGSQFLILLLLVGLLLRLVVPVLAGRADPRHSLASLALCYLPLLLLSAFGSVFWAVALWGVRVLGGRQTASPPGLGEWEDGFLRHVGYDVLLAEWVMAVVTVGIAALAGVALRSYLAAARGGPAPAGAAVGGGTVARTWLGRMLAVMLWLLALPGVAMVLSSPLNPFWVSLAEKFGVSVLAIYSWSASRVVSSVPLVSRHGAIVLRVTGDVAFYVADAGSALSIRAEAQARVKELLLHLLKAYLGDEVAVVGHSQGSVIAYDVLRGLATAGELPKGRLRLVTMGSPLEALYEDFLGRPLTPFGSDTVAWVNLYRSGDYIGGPINQAGVENIPLGSGGHLNYWVEEALRDNLE
jgi:hypothetical protein